MLNLTRENEIYPPETDKLAYPHQSISHVIITNSKNREKLANKIENSNRTEGSWIASRKRL